MNIVTSGYRTVSVVATEWRHRSPMAIDLIPGRHLQSPSHVKFLARLSGLQQY